MSSEKKGEKNAVYISVKPLYVYTDVAFMVLQKAGQTKIAARGSMISRAIIVVHRLLGKYAGVRLMDEHTSTVELEDNRPPREENPEAPVFQNRNYQPSIGQGPRKRLVAVYEAILGYEPVAKTQVTSPTPPPSAPMLRVGRFYRPTPRGKRIVELINEGKSAEQAVETIIEEESSSDGQVVVN